MADPKEPKTPGDVEFKTEVRGGEEHRDARNGPINGGRRHREAEDTKVSARNEGVEVAHSESSRGTETYSIVVKGARLETLNGKLLVNGVAADDKDGQFSAKVINAVKDVMKDGVLTRQEAKHIASDMPDLVAAIPTVQPNNGRGK